jgi:aminoglycoside phosphotransferase (APT) family kinase protein
MSAASEDDHSRLRRFLDDAGIGSGPVRLRPIGSGKSNLTMALERDGCVAVLRRPPEGPLPPSAHDVIREARIMRALRGQIAVPAIRAVCEDVEVIGAPFFVMEMVDGHVISDRLPDAFADQGSRRKLGEVLIDSLVEIHAVDPQAAGLGWLGSSSDYRKRQMRRFNGLWETNRTREIPEIEKVSRWLEERLPSPVDSTIVHGDFRLGNVIVAKRGDGPEIQAVLDWEMSTVGDPLADLGYLTALWIEPGDPDLAVMEKLMTTRQGGFHTRAELIDRYEEQSGRPVSEIRWYQVFALWKAAIFMEGNYRRARAVPDAEAEALGTTVLRLVEMADQIGPSADVGASEVK